MNPYHHPHKHYTIITIITIIVQHVTIIDIITDISQLPRETFVNCDHHLISRDGKKMTC